MRRAVQIARRGMGEPKTKEIRREETLDAALVEFAERHAGRG